MNSVTGISNIDYTKVRVTYVEGNVMCAACKGAGGYYGGDDIWHECKSCYGSGYIGNNGSTGIYEYQIGKDDTTTLGGNWFTFDTDGTGPNVQIGEDGVPYEYTITGSMCETEEELEPPRPSNSHLKPLFHTCGWKKWEFNKKDE